MKAYAIIPVNLWEYCNNPKIEQNANVKYFLFILSCRMGDCGNCRNRKQC
jgi:hypothetical protein